MAITNVVSTMRVEKREDILKVRVAGAARTSDIGGKD